ncbi:MAG: hypothetical protein ACRD6N_19605, partial [Pyrinomonadaceae bacterium]
SSTMGLSLLEGWSTDMNLFKRIVITLNVYAVFAIVGALLGAICSYLLVGMLYRAAYPGPVANGHDCARGTLAAFCALAGGTITGTSVAFYYASKVLFQRKLGGEISETERSLTKAEWDTTLGRRLRAASHYAGAGGFVISFSGFGDPTMFGITFLLGVIFLIVGGVAFLRAHILNAQEPSTE